MWKTPDQKPESTGDIIYTLENGEIGYFFHIKGRTFPTSCAGNQFHWGLDTPICMTKWCYLTDLIAQADKAERLQKAVDLAVGALKRINETYEEEYYKGDDEHDSCDWLNCADDMDDLATDTIDEIKQLIKGE